MATSDAYLAGLFDGEGCVTMHLAKAGYVSVQVKVSMCDRAPIEALHTRFGGRFDDGTRVTKTGRFIYTWTLFNSECVEALQIFAQQCLVKHTVAKAALPTAQNMYNNPTRGVLSQEEKISRIQAAQLIAKMNKPVGYQRVLNETDVQSYLSPKRMGGGKRVRLSDGRIFDTVQAAAAALGVSISAVSLAKRKGTRTAGLLVEAV